MISPTNRRALALLALSVSAGPAFAQDAEKKLEASIIQRTEEKEAAMRAEAASRLKQAVLRLAEVEDLLKDAEKEIALWAQYIDPLQEGEEGRYLTFDERDVRICYSLLLLQRRPAPGIVAGLRSALEPLAADIRAKAAAADPAHPLPDSYMQALAELRAEAAQVRAAYNEPRLAIQGIYARAKKAGKKGELPLEIAMSAHAAAHAEELAARIEQEQMEAKRANAEKIGKAEAEKLRAEGEYRAGKIMAEKRIAEAETKDLVTETDRELLLRRASSPEVLQALAPFVTKGRNQPFGLGSAPSVDYKHLYRVNFVEKGRPQPISLSYLSSKGALQTNADGLCKLLSIANSAGNDRPDWPHAVTDEEWETVAEKQKLLIELGPYLVEGGHLLP